MQKHPRLRGEDRKPPRIGTARKETPPLTRGRLPNGTARGFPAGNTPAYAGKTPKARHPDEKLPETPPLTRGRLDRAAAMNAHDGNTPAYAGKT